MGVDTKVRLRGHISADRICCYLESKYSNVENKVKTNISNFEKDKYTRYLCYDDNPDYLVTESGFIHFIDNSGDRRSLFYYYTNINDFSDLVTLYNQNCSDDVLLISVVERTCLSIGLFGNSIENMKGICKHFGGWIDENDCDNESFYWIDKE